MYEVFVDNKPIVISKNKEYLSEYHIIENEEKIRHLASATIFENVILGIDTSLETQPKIGRNFKVFLPLKSLEVGKFTTNSKRYFLSKDEAIGTCQFILVILPKNRS